MVTLYTRPPICKCSGLSEVTSVASEQQICYLHRVTFWSVIVQQQIPHTSTCNLNVFEPTEIRAGVIQIYISYKPLLASGLNFKVTEKEERSLGASLDKEKIVTFSSLIRRQRTSSQKIYLFWGFQLSSLVPLWKFFFFLAQKITVFFQVCF